MDQRLSLVAQYDDLIRYFETFVGGDLIEEKVKALLKNCETQRDLCLIQRNELNNAQDQINKLKKDNNRLETTLKNVRAAFECEVNLKEKLKRERDSLIKKLAAIQSFLIDDHNKENNSYVKEKILNSLKDNKLSHVAEHTLTDDDSLSDIEFDKTDDDLLQSTRNRISTSAQHDELLSNYNQQIGIESYDTLEEVEKNDQFYELKLDEKFNSLGQFKSGSSISSQMNALSQSLTKQRLSIPELTGLNELKIDNRPHQFVIKKVYRPEQCGPCGQSIGFCTSGYRCRDCRAVCHLSCKDLVPLPCIPYVSRANIGKQGRLVLISDFTPPNVRPCVPALIIHCCTEIEKRGLEVIGVYKISGSIKDVSDYKERILDSKKGIPNLSTVDIYVLCGVVKDFLKSLDESLITKLAWRDFVTGSAIKNEEQRAFYLYDLISNLHVANRDTLAYIILHLQKIAASPDCKMPASSLAKVFGPTVVGFSMKDPPSDQMKEENLKQIAVMEALLQLTTDFWENVISQKSTLGLMRKESVNKVINNLNRGTASAPKLDGYSNYSNSRMSIGSRLCGGRVASGTLTPLKSTNPRNSSKIFKPLF